MNTKQPFLLLTPGPVPVPDEIWAAIAQPVIYHRNKEFESIFDDLQKGLQYLFQTQSLTFGMIGSGTTGTEALIYSLFRKKEKVLFTDFGKFSERWGEYAALIGLETVKIVAEWGKTISATQILSEIERQGDIKGLVLTHCETSTGVLLDVEEIAFAVKQVFPEILIVVDGISSIGATPFYFDDWQIDAAVVASQKALHNPAGTAYFALSTSAQAALQPTSRADYMNLWNYAESAKQLSFPYSPPVNLFYGVIAALDSIQRQSLPFIWNEVHENARTFRNLLPALSYTPFGESPSDTLTAFTSEKHALPEIKKALYQENIVVSGGQDQLKGKILRIAHYNSIEPEDLERIAERLRG